MKYTNKRNGKIYEQISEVNEKFKTVVLRDVETGKEAPITTATLKRWYAVIEESEMVEEPAREPETETCSDGTLYTDVMTEIISGAEKRAKEVKKDRKPRQKKEMARDARALHEYTINTCEEIGGTVFIPAKEMKFRIFKVGKNGFVKYSWSNNSITLQVHSKALGLDAPANPCNHSYDDKYVFREDTPESRAEIFRIMKTCYDWQVCKNLAREEKKGGKKKEEKKTA